SPRAGAAKRAGAGATHRDQGRVAAGRRSGRPRHASGAAPSAPAQDRPARADARRGQEGVSPDMSAFADTLEAVAARVPETQMVMIMGTDGIPIERLVVRPDP